MKRAALFVFLVAGCSGAEFTMSYDSGFSFSVEAGVGFGLDSGSSDANQHDEDHTSVLPRDAAEDRQIPVDALSGGDADARVDSGSVIVEACPDTLEYYKKMQEQIAGDHIIWCSPTTPCSSGQCCYNGSVCVAK